MPNLSQLNTSGSPSVNVFAGTKIVPPALAQRIAFRGGSGAPVYGLEFQSIRARKSRAVVQSAILGGLEEEEGGRGG